MRRKDMSRLSIVFILSLICAILLFSYASILAYIFGTILGFIMLMIAIVTGRVLIKEIKYHIMSYFRNIKKSKI